MITDVNATKLNDSVLLEYVQLAIKAEFQNWVLFSNGTYVIVEEGDTTPDTRAYALAQMRGFGPVYVGSPAGDFSVINLHTTEGWIVSGHGSGMYTYVHPSELGNHAPTDVEIGMYGRSKRAADAEELSIIHINGPN